MTTYTIQTAGAPACTHQAGSPAEAAQQHARRCLLRFVALQLIDDVDADLFDPGRTFQPYARERGAKWDRPYGAKFRVDVTDD